MNFEKMSQYTDRLKSEISPALGCTEPAAVALAAAYAAKELPHKAKTIHAAVSTYILKNGMNVGIPGTGMIGLDIAVALGAICATPEKQLMVLNDIQSQQKDLARQMVADRCIQVTLADTPEKIYIAITLDDGSNTTKAVISGTHTTLTELWQNDTLLFSNENSSPVDEQIQGKSNFCMSLEEILDYIQTVSIKDLSFLQDVMTLHKEISQEGLDGDYGLKVGKSMMDNSSLFSIDISNYAIACTAAAADARMSGCDKPVMSTAGSGNQGLTASIPVACIGEKLSKSNEKVLRSLALSILVTVHVKHYIGRLSVLCGCSVAAAIGSCCGIIYLLDGTLENMKHGINTMVADISGVVCDGAKPGCALKIATAVSSAIRAASMAMRGIGANSHDGIVTMDVEQTLANLGTLGNDAMVKTNTIILDMMLNK